MRKFIYAITNFMNTITGQSPKKRNEKLPVMYRFSTTDRVSDFKQIPRE